MSKLLLNGCSLKEALEKFKVFKEKTHSREGKSYFTIDEYMELLDQTLGCDGYCVHYGKIDVLALPNGEQLLMTEHVAIDLFDVDGNVCYTIEGNGSFELPTSKNNNRFINLSTAAGNCDANAVKSALRNIGTFGSRDTSNAKPNTLGNSSSAAAATGSSDTTPTTKRFYSCKPMEIFWSDNAGKPAYKCLCHEMIDSKKASEKECEVLFFPLNYKGCNDKLNTLLANSGNLNGYCFSAEVVLSPKGNPGNLAGGSFLMKKII